MQGFYKKDSLHHSIWAIRFKDSLHQLRRHHLEKYI